MRATPDFDFGLTEEAQMIRETVARFADDRIAPLAAKADREDWFPQELWPEMGELGLHGMTVSEEDGGTGLGYLEHTIAVEEVSRASASIGLSYGAHSNLCVNQIARWGNAQQKTKYLPGPDFRRSRGRAGDERAGRGIGRGFDEAEGGRGVPGAGGGYLLNGTKFWITNGHVAETLVVYAKTDADAGSKGITAFLIEKDMDGFCARPEDREDGHARVHHQRNWCSRIAMCRKKTCWARWARAYRC